MIYLEPAIQFECSAMSGHARKSLSDIIYTAPKDGGNDYLYVNAKGVVHDIWYGIVEPGRFYTYVVATNVYANVGESGGFAIEFCRQLLPTYVSFANVQLLELPRTSTNAVGYYAQASKAHLLDHGDHGAGEWIDVGQENQISDTVGVEINDPPWLGGGAFTWPIPVAWRVKDDEGTTNLFCNTDQRFELDADGTARILKFGYTGERMTNGVFSVIKDQQ